MSNYTRWPSSGGGGTWGSITGVLSSQTDLQNALNLKLNLSGGTMSGVLDMNGHKIVNDAAPTNPNDVVNKAYADALAGGLMYLAPVADFCLANDSLNTPPGSPPYSVVYIVAIGGTGAWTGLDGHAVQWIHPPSNPSNPITWVDLFGRAIQAGDRFIIDRDATIGELGGNMVGNYNAVVQVVNGTLPLTAASYTFTAPAAQNAAFDTNTNSDHYGQTLAYNGSVWVQIAGPGVVSVGAALSYTANVLNVKVDGSTIQVNGSNQLTAILTSGAATNINGIVKGNGTILSAAVAGTDYEAVLTPGNITTSTSGITIGSGTSSTVGPDVTINILTATTSQSGLISATDFTTFTNDTLVTTTMANANYPIVLAPTSSTGQQSLVMDTDVTYNPYTDTLTLPSTGMVYAGSIQVQTFFSYGVSSISGAGSTQGTATAITTSEVNIFSGAANSGVILPSSPTTNGLTVFVTNNTSNNIYLYPPSGGTIDGGATNAAITLPGGQSLGITLFSSGAWYTTTNLIYGGTGIAVSHGAGGVFLNLNTPVSIANGGTNAITAAAALTSLGALPTAGGTMTGNLQVKTVTEPPVSLGNMTTTATVNWASGDVQEATLTGSTTITWSNQTSGQSFTLILTQGGSGSYTITWPTTRWANGTAPTLSTTVAKTDIVSFYYDGTSTFGFVGGIGF